MESGKTTSKSFTGPIMVNHYGPRNALSTPCLRGERGHWQPAVTVRLAPLQSFDEGVVLGT